MENSPLDIITEQNWRQALENVEADETVGIRHAAINGDENYRTHVAAIPEKVGCHVHEKGEEHYKVVAGKGTLYSGKVLNAEENNITWEEPMPVQTGDSFTIPEGYAHQLIKRGNEDLVIVFGCPDTHLTTDRTMLNDAPELDSPFSDLGEDSPER